MMSIASPPGVRKRSSLPSLQSLSWLERSEKVVAQCMNIASWSRTCHTAARDAAIVIRKGRVFICAGEIRATAQAAARLSDQDTGCSAY